MRTQLITWVTGLLRVWFRRQPALSAAPRSILVIKPCCIGDVLLTTPLLAVVRAGYPTSRITYAVGRWAEPMVATSEHVDAVLTLPDRWTLGAWLATVRVLRQCTFDLVFVPDRSPVLTLLAWVARIPRRIGLDSAGRGFAYTHRVPVTSIVRHEADQYNGLALAAGLPQPPRQLYFFPTDAAQAQAAALLAQHRSDDQLVVAIHPGGGQNPGMSLHRKRWLPPRWAQVVDHFHDQHHATVILLGGPGDEEAVAAVQRATHAPVAALVQRWDWNVLGALLRQCDLFLGHDTGMMHLATAVNTPTVAIFGPSDPQIYGPYSSRSTYVWRPTYESPCFYEGVAQPDCPCAMQCMRNVAVADVIQAVERVLTDSKKG